jgi:hypothetical protein
MSDDELGDEGDGVSTDGGGLVGKMANGERGEFGSLTGELGVETERAQYRREAMEGERKTSQEKQD